MAKSKKSGSQKALRAYRRATLKAPWQEAADERRYAVLQSALEAPKVEVQTSAAEEADVDMDAEQRGRAGKPSKGDKMDTTQDSGSGKKRKGVKVGGKGVSKRRSGKLFLATKQAFHNKGKKGKKGSR